MYNNIIMNNMLIEKPKPIVGVDSNEKIRCKITIIRGNELDGETFYDLEQSVQSVDKYLEEGNLFEVSLYRTFDSPDEVTGLSELYDLDHQGQFMSLEFPKFYELDYILQTNYEDIEIPNELCVSTAEPFSKGKASDMWERFLEGDTLREVWNRLLENPWFEGEDIGTEEKISSYLLPSQCHTEDH